MPRVFWPVWLLLACLAAVAGLKALRPSQAAPAPVTQSAPSTGPTSRAALDEPLDLVPAESLLCWYGRAFPDTNPLSGGSPALSTILQVLPRALDAKAQLSARIVEAFGLAICYRHALVLIDAQAKPVESDPTARRVDRLRFAAIVQLRDQEEAFARIIQAAVNEQTDQTNATLTRHEAHGWKYQELRDRRLPEWSAFAWGKIGEHFVLTVGPDVWPSIAAVAAGQAPALSRADWLASVRGARGRNALLEIIVAAHDIRARLDPFVDGRATDFFAAWHAGNLERAHWALGLEGPALYCVGHFMEEGRVRERIFADPRTREPRLLATIPDTARYAIYQVAPERVIPALFAGVLATQGRETRQRVEELWARIQAEQGFDARRDILAHLGEYSVLHNDPPHPLRVPLALTTLTEIRDQPERVRETIETMCRAWHDAQQQAAERRGTPSTLSIERERDGIWYLRYGPIAGPAWLVTDRFIVTSWSPIALRTYLEKVGDRAGHRAK